VADFQVNHVKLQGCKNIIQSQDSSRTIIGLKESAADILERPENPVEVVETFRKMGPFDYSVIQGSPDANIRILFKQPVQWKV